MSCQIESLEDRQENENIIKNLKSDPKKKKKKTILLNVLAKYVSNFYRKCLR